MSILTNLNALGLVVLFVLLGCMFMILLGLIHQSTPSISSLRLHLSTGSGARGRVKRTLPGIGTPISTEIRTLKMITANANLIAHL